MRLLSLAPLLTLLLVPACASAPKDDTAPANDDTAAADTDTDADSDADTDADSDADTDADPVNDTLGFDLTGTYTGSTLSLTSVDGATLGSSTMTYGAVLTHAAATARMEVSPGTPASGLLQDYDAANYPGLKVAYFLPALHVDTNGDGVHTAGEDYVGVGGAFAMYIDGDPSVVPALAGATRGWNAAAFSGGTLAIRDAAHIPLDAALGVDNALTFSGTWSGTLPAHPRLALMSAVYLGGGTVADPVIADTSAGATWTVSLSAAPPSDHFASSSGLGIDVAAETSVAYDDVNTNGKIDRSDSKLYHFCSGSTPVSALYIPGVDSLDLAMALSRKGLSAGWVPLLQEASPTLGDATTASNLVISSSCPI